MNPLDRIKNHINNDNKKARYLELVPFEWRALFTFLDWLMWTNENDDESLADFLPFYYLARKKLKDFNMTIDDLPRIVTEENHIRVWFKCSRTFHIEALRDLERNQVLVVNKFKNRVRLTIGEA